MCPTCKLHATPGSALGCVTSAVASVAHKHMFYNFRNSTSSKRALGNTVQWVKKNNFHKEKRLSICGKAKKCLKLLFYHMRVL